MSAETKQSKKPEALVEEKSPNPINKCPKCSEFASVVSEREPNNGRFPGYYCVCGMRWALPNQPPLTCRIEEVLSPTVLRMISDAPANPVARVLVQGISKVPIPDELTDFNSIRYWIETNVKGGNTIKDYMVGPFTYRHHTDVSGSCVFSGYRESQNASMPINSLVLFEYILAEMESPDDPPAELQQLLFRVLERLCPEQMGRITANETSDHAAENDSEPELILPALTNEMIRLKQFIVDCGRNDWLQKLGL